MREASWRLMCVVCGLGLLAFGFPLWMAACCSAPENRGPTLSTALKSNCYNWPEQAFSATNKTGSIIVLDEGTPAIDFTLRDPGGRSYTLSSLLATRPVLMVFGAFT